MEEMLVEVRKEHGKLKIDACGCGLGDVWYILLLLYHTEIRVNDFLFIFVNIMCGFPLEKFWTVTKLNAIFLTKIGLIYLSLKNRYIS